MATAHWPGSPVQVGQRVRVRSVDFLDSTNRTLLGCEGTIFEVSDFHKVRVGQRVLLLATEELTPVLMGLCDAITQLSRAGENAYATRPDLDARLYFQGEGKPLRYRRTAASHGWEWTPSAADLVSHTWMVVLPEVR